MEAPNWSSDGDALFLNGNGVLWRLDVAAPGSGLAEIVHEGLPAINNDHVLDPDGRHIYLSANDGHIYRAALSGGPVDRVTADEGVWHFLHGVSPDGRRLAYVRLAALRRPGTVGDHEPRRADDRRGHRRRTHRRTGVVARRRLDLPEHRGLHRRTRPRAAGPGAGRRAGGRRRGGRTAGLQRHRRLVPAPVPGRAAGLLHHLPDRDPRPPGRSRRGGPAGRHPGLDDSAAAVSAVGGQGTINVNSWAPDSTRFAFVAYSVD